MIWGCCYNNLPHTWNFTHNLKNSEEATFHYYLKLCLVSEPGHWVIIFFIKASNYLMNSMIILHLGVYFGWRYSFIKCKHLMLTLTLYKKKKCWAEFGSDCNVSTSGFLLNYCSRLHSLPILSTDILRFSFSNEFT